MYPVKQKYPYAHLQLSADTKHYSPVPPHRITCAKLCLPCRYLTEVCISWKHRGNGSRFLPSTNHCLFTATLMFVSGITFGVLGAAAGKSQRLAWMVRSVEQDTRLLHQTFTPGILAAWDLWPLNRSPRQQPKQDGKEHGKNHHPKTKNLCYFP